MRKISMFVLLSIFSLCLTIKPLTVDASHTSSVPITGNLDKVEQTTSENPKEKEILTEKQTIVKETVLPKTGDKSLCYLSLMGILLLLSGLVVMYRKSKMKE
ncbi:TPA: LPXTG cell wall anchor domain-containing protein [Listeria monocytogenes]